MAECRGRILVVDDDEGLRDAQVTLARGYELLYTGESAAALDAFVASEAIWRPQAEAWWIAPSLADVLIGRGRALIDLGRGEEARPALEEAIAALTAHLPRDPRASPRMLLEDGRAALVSAPADP